MDQSEDTELRDLVVEALEKNGAAAKIRALLRANVFLVFEDEGRNLKQNPSLDDILKLPEGALCLSIIHEFLEFCSLKNTLFVYMAESRQGTGYKYEGKENLASKLNLSNRDNSKEPLLLTLLRCTTHQAKNFDQGEAADCKTEDRSNHNNFTDDQNCSYIIHEDSNSSGTSHSHSDKSDKKNKLHLRLQLDNSDTDTSSDSIRDKSRLEYVPNKHILAYKEKAEETKVKARVRHVKHEKQPKIFGDSSTNRSYLQEPKLIATNSSTDSTSYLDLKAYNLLDHKLLNTTGIPVSESEEKNVSHVFNSETEQHNLHLGNNLQERKSEAFSSRSLKHEDVQRKLQALKLSSEDVVKSDAESLDYSNDFDLSPINENKNTSNSVNSQVSYKDDDEGKLPKNCSFESPRQSSRSSISISDVADLLSERSSSFSLTNEDNVSGYKLPYKSKKRNYYYKSDDSFDFSGSPIPSLSNLSFDIHSD